MAPEPTVRSPLMDATNQQTVPKLKPAVDEKVCISSEGTGARLAAFAAGCLGAPSPAKAGQKLGLMGSCSEPEVMQLLKHLEVLSRQRAAKLGNAGAAQVAACSELSSCSPGFEAALLRACGVAGGGLPGLFAKLPHDSEGRADLLRIFGMAAVASGASSQAPKVSSVEYTSEYFEHASELPAVSASVRSAAERHLAANEVTEASWETDASAVNALRAAMVNSSTLEDPVVASPELLAALAARCSSRRPALAKAALHALAELAGQHASQDGCKAWPDSAEVVIAACLSALRATKVVTRVAEVSLAAATRRVAADASPAAAVAALVECTGAAVKAKPPQPTAVAAGLRALAPLAPGLSRMPGWEGAEEAASTAAAAAALCDEVLKCRTLGSAFADARALLRALPHSGQREGEVGGERSAASGIEEGKSAQSQMRAKMQERRKLLETSMDDAKVRVID
eukprot:gnl/TRDRNA2_/TRDRNA2_80392_c0_seq1.p1 gnl/TRDRNA2_/TRDRNA2_80392_c0~~gnl/TRDRNA2_/TRDRNA2_80392_c0_seq1.p1  ORF type:complete len:456 (+),score=106.04 gnl/TRDRNA2_/TRDRNA2_80392_c0_seq1:75-1442(+)